MKKATENQNSLYSVLEAVEPPQGLYAAIMARIEAAARRSAKIRAGLFGLVVVASGAALVPVMQYTASQFYASGFYDYLSLILSDHSLVLTYWREFGLSLIESLPSIAILLMLPISAALLWSLVRLVKNARAGFMTIGGVSA
jgi:hypothetical protein